MFTFKWQSPLPALGIMTGAKEEVRWHCYRATKSDVSCWAIHRSKPPLYTTSSLHRVNMGNCCLFPFSNQQSGPSPIRPPHPPPNHSHFVCTFVRRVHHIKCHSKPISLKWEWVIKPSNTESALMQAYTPHSSQVQHLFCVRDGGDGTYL